jgi:hypothetical protein
VEPTQSSTDWWHSDPVPEIQGAMDAAPSSQQSAADIVQHQIRALVTTMGCQQNDLVQQLALQNNQHHMNLVATVVSAVTKATQAAERQRATAMAAAPQQPAQDGGWHWWPAMGMAGHPQTRPVWNGYTNDQHADNWTADAWVWPDNTQAYNADGSNTCAQAAHNTTLVVAASLQALDTPMTGMQMVGPAGWPTAEVPGVPAVQVNAEVPVVQAHAEVPAPDAEVADAVGSWRQINQDENH